MEHMDIIQALTINYIVKTGPVSAEQVGETVYLAWSEAIKNIYNRCKELCRSESFVDSSRQMSNVTDDILFNHIFEATALIGEVNGCPLCKNIVWRSSELTWLLLAYYKYPPKETPDIKKSDLSVGKNWPIFQYRTERFFARKIIEQQLKSRAMIEDDLEDLKLS